jgi:hypothetical protein
MDDQPFAGKHPQRRRRIEIAARALAVRRRAADQLIIEKQKVLDGRGHRIERGLTLPSGKPNFEDAVLGCQCYWLSELWSNCGIGFSLGTLRPGRRDAASKHDQYSEGTTHQQAEHTTCVARVVA